MHWPWPLQPLGHGPGVHGIVQKSPPLPGNGQQSFDAQSEFCVHAAPNAAPPEEPASPPELLLVLPPLLDPLPELEPLLELDAPLEPDELDEVEPPLLDELDPPLLDELEPLDDELPLLVELEPPLDPVSPELLPDPDPPLDELPPLDPEPCELAPLDEEPVDPKPGPGVSALLQPRATMPARSADARDAMSDRCVMATPPTATGVRERVVTRH